MHYDLSQLAALNEAVKMVEEAINIKEAKTVDPEKWVAVYRQPKGKDQYWMETRSANSYASRSLNKAKLFDSKEEAEKFAKIKTTIGPEFVGAKQVKSITESTDNFEELEESKKKYDPDFWRKPGREETDMLDNVDIDQIVKWLSYARKDKPELQKTSFHTMLQMRHDRWYNGSEWKTKKRPSKQDSDKAMAKWRAGRREKMLASFSPEEKEKYLENEKKNQKLANQAAMLWFMGYMK